MEFDCLDIKNVVGFDWDEGNIRKNEIKHNLKWQIIEEVFYNQPLIIIKTVNIQIFKNVDVQLLEK